jgi:putative sterol carrier protein
MRMSASDYLAVADGRLSGMKALLTGRIKTSGDLSLLKRMEGWFVR